MNLEEKYPFKKLPVNTINKDFRVQPHLYKCKCREPGYLRFVFHETQRQILTNQISLILSHDQ